MKYNSIHKFARIADARKFVEAIRNAGFKRVGYVKNGGVIYSNGAHKMMVYVSR